MVEAVLGHSWRLLDQLGLTESVNGVPTRSLHYRIRNRHVLNGRPLYSALPKNFPGLKNGLIITSLSILHPILSAISSQRRLSYPTVIWLCLETYLSGVLQCSFKYSMGTLVSDHDNQGLQVNGLYKRPAPSCKVHT